MGKEARDRENREAGLRKERDGEEDGEKEPERKLEKGRDTERDRDTEDGNKEKRTGEAVTCSWGTPGRD